jgi:HSP20 family molecular chaperone IbpA
MPRLSVFNSPLLLGFDHFERMLDQASKASAEGYPPYNIEQQGENVLIITLAVAGFSMEDLNVSLEDNQLVIRGQLTENSEIGLDKEKTVFLHRGIASRQFQRSFVLAEGIEVKNASLDNGLLLIDLERLQPEPEIRNIKIENGKSFRTASKQKTIDVQSD